MPLTLLDLIERADKRIPNSFSNSDKVDWLNEVNHDFFEKVKVPSISTFTTTAGTATYILSPTDIRGRNIVRVMVGTSRYSSILFDEDIKPGNNYWTFNDNTREVTLDPAPIQPGQTGIVVYYKIPATTFTDTNLNAVPDAPEEYHWIYAIGVCERIAKTMRDVELANNYSNDYNSAIAIAQQNYRLYRPL